MFCIGNAADNYRHNMSQDRIELPRDVIKLLERRYSFMRNPYLLLHEDVEFHDFIRQQAEKVLPFPAVRTANGEVVFLHKPKTDHSISHIIKRIRKFTMRPYRSLVSV